MDRNVRGIVPVLQTPIKNGGIDRESIKRHVEWLVTQDIGGLWVLGTGGEDMHLPFQKRLTVAKTVCDANFGRKPLILGCGFYSLYETEKFIELTSDLDYDAYHLMPYHPLVSWDRLLVAYRYFANSVPLWAYSSANWSRSMPLWFVEKLKASGVKGIKFSSQRTSDLQKVIGLQSKEFQVITAVATQFLVCLQMGALGSTTSIAGVYPDKFIQLHRAYQRGKLYEAQRWQQRITLDVGRMNLAKKDNFLSGAEEKELLVEMGIYETAEMTFPYRKLTNRERKQLFEAES